MTRRILLFPLLLGACPPPALSPLPPFCEPSQGPCPPEESSSTTDNDEEPTPTGGIQTVTGDDTTTDSLTTATTTSSTTDEPSEPAIEKIDFTPNPIELAGTIVVDVAAKHADGVRMQLEGTEPTELTKSKDGHFTGAIEVLTGLSNGTHDATFVPWRANDEGSEVQASYTIALPDAGSEVIWDATPDLGQGEVDALAVTASGHVLVFGTYWEGNTARCFLHRRGLDGKPTADTVPVFPNLPCRAIDIVAGDGDGYWLLVEVEGGNGPRWRLASGVWGQDPLVIRTGLADETAHALARSPLGQLAVCGTGPSPIPVFDKIDAHVWRIQGTATVFDYLPPLDLAHRFDETVRDCAFADEQLRIVGEVYGRHEVNDQQAPKRKRPFLLDTDLNGGAPQWFVPGLGPGNITQGSALTMAIDDQGRTLMGLYTCTDACQPAGELRRYDADGELSWQMMLAPDISMPRALAWSPAGYVVMASAQVVTDWETKFLLQAYLPGTYKPAWTYAKATLPTLHLAQAVAVAPGVVVGGGFGSGGYWTLAFVAP